MKKKAISPVIATLLLILIAIAASILVYIWVTGYASSVTGAEATQLQEKIKIDAVSVNSSATTVYVRNIGEVKVTITDIYIVDSITSEIVNHTSFTNEQIDPGKVEALTVKTSLKSGHTYIAKVVTSNGVEATKTFVYKG